MNFAKKLFLGSFIAMSSVAFFACGGDSSSTTEPTTDDPTQPVVIPTKKDANITVSADTSSRRSGYDAVFKGRFDLDITKDSSENDANIAFDSIGFKVLDANNVPVSVVLKYNTIQFPLNSSLDLGSNAAPGGLGLTINLQDPGFTTCGIFKLMISLRATNGTDKFERTELISFEREAELFCKAPESSSATEPVKQEVNMTPCIIEGLSTNLKPGIKIADCSATDAASADIVFTKAGTRDEPDITVSGNNGIVFVELINNRDKNYADDYDTDSWPEDVNGRSAYVSDFKLNTALQKNSLEAMLENFGTIYVAKNPTAYNAETGAGMYPFAISNYKPGDNGNTDFTVKLYKVAQ